jgi:hypothetical protein
MPFNAKKIQVHLSPGPSPQERGEDTNAPLSCGEGLGERWIQAKASLHIYNVATLCLFIISPSLGGGRGEVAGWEVVYLFTTFILLTLPSLSTVMI